MTEAVAKLPAWRASRARAGVEIFLSTAAIEASQMPIGKVCGLDSHLTVVATEEPITEEAGRTARAVVIEVVPDQFGSMERLRQLIRVAPNRPVIAAVDRANISEIRSLMHEGVEDILQLPLTHGDLENSIARIRDRFESIGSAGGPFGKIVSITKCRGGMGATTILTQLGCMIADRSKKPDDVCLVDFDVQFGNAALYLGNLPEVGVKDLLDAGARADSAMVNAMATKHASGLNYLAAPNEIMPLNVVDSDQVLLILDLLAAEYGTVLVDLPMSWTNWSLSALARSDAIFMVGELSIASLHQAKRQIDFMRQQDVLDTSLKIVMNRTEKRLFKALDFDDAENILGAPVAFDIADDARVVRAALDQGLPVTEIESRSKVAKDLARIAAAIPELVAAEA